MNKYRIKHVDTWFEPKGKPDPIKSYFFAVLLLLVGFFGVSFNQRQFEELRLKNPATINVKYVEARCSHKRGIYMVKTYKYSLTQSGGWEQEYKVYDSIPYASISKCEAVLQNANTISPRTEVWYDQDALWNSKWSLGEPPPLWTFWYFSIPGGMFLIFGLFEHRRMKQHREHDRHNG